MTKLAEDIFKRLHITTLVHGNMEKEDAVELQKVIEDVLQSEPLTEAEKASDVSLFLPECALAIGLFSGLKLSLILMLTCLCILSLVARLAAAAAQ